MKTRVNTKKMCLLSRKQIKQPFHPPTAVLHDPNGAVCSCNFAFLIAVEPRILLDQSGGCCCSPYVPPAPLPASFPLLLKHTFPLKVTRVTHLHVKCEPFDIPGLSRAPPSSFVSSDARVQPNKLPAEWSVVTLSVSSGQLINRKG